MPAKNSARVRLNDRVIRLTADGNRYAGTYVVTAIEPDEAGFRRVVTLTGPGGSAEKRGRLHPDGSITIGGAQLCDVTEATDGC